MTGLMRYEKSTINGNFFFNFFGFKLAKEWHVLQSKNWKLASRNELKNNNKRNNTNTWNNNNNIGNNKILFKWHANTYWYCYCIYAHARPRTYKVLLITRKYLNNPISQFDLIRIIFFLFFFWFQFQFQFRIRFELLLLWLTPTFLAPIYFYSKLLHSIKNISSGLKVCSV